MKYSPYCHYATRALVFLATKTEDGPALVRTIAQHENIPQHTLSKVMIELKRGGLVNATLGPGGGFELAKTPESITCDDILSALNCDMEFEFQQAGMCLLGLNDCNDECPCILHKTWCNFRMEFRKVMSTMTLADVVGVIKARNAAGMQHGCTKQRS